MSLLDSIDNSFAIRSEDKIRILSNIICENNLEILLETNPELPSRAILILIDMRVAKQYVSSQTIRMFFERCIHLIASVGIFNFGLNAIVNVIKIAKYYDARDFLFELEELLDHKMFHRSPDFLSNIIYQYPQFVVSLIDLVPNFFFDNNRDVLQVIIKSFFFRKKLFRDIVSEKIFDYIWVLRTIFLHIDKRSSYKRDMLDVLHHFARIILESKDLDILDIKQLSIRQIEDLIWLLESVDDIEFKMYMEEKLKSSKIIHYVTPTLFEASPQKKQKTPFFSI